jgi:hypothetical protein
MKPTFKQFLKEMGAPVNVGSKEFSQLVTKVQDDLEASEFAPQDAEYGDATTIRRKVMGILAANYQHLDLQTKEALLAALMSFYGVDE